MHIITILINCGADLDGFMGPETDLSTPLHVFCRIGHRAAVRAVLERFEMELELEGGMNVNESINSESDNFMNFGLGVTSSLAGEGEERGERERGSSNSYSDRSRSRGRGRSGSGTEGRMGGNNVNAALTLFDRMIASPPERTDRDRDRDRDRGDGGTLGQGPGIGPGIGYGASIWQHPANRRDSRGNTPLHWACLEGHTQIAHLILDSSKNVRYKTEARRERQDSNSNSQSGATTGNNNTNSNSNSSNSEGGSPTRETEAEAVDVNAKNDFGWTPLLTCVRTGDKGLVGKMVQVSMWSVWGCTSISILFTNNNITHNHHTNILISFIIISFVLLYILVTRSGCPSL